MVYVMPSLKQRYRFNFVSHLAVCEFNYHRLMRLLPQRFSPKQEQREQWHYLLGQDSGEMAIIFEVKESAKYTTTVHIVVYSSLQKSMLWIGEQQKPILRKSAPKRAADEPKHPLDSIKSAVLSNGSKHYSMDVRIYHDATLAEVVAWQGHRQLQPRHEYPNPKMYQEDEKAQLNTFLGELLAFCLEKGRIMENVLTMN